MISHEMSGNRLGVSVRASARASPSTGDVAASGLSAVRVGDVAAAARLLLYR
jgi:hypothetical protein